MTRQPFTVEKFGGLNLADDRLEVGAEQAREAWNVDFDQLGRVRTRAGYTTVVTLTLTSADGFAVFETTAGLKQAVVGYSNGGTKKYEAYSTTGGAAVASATPASAGIDAVRFGTPSNQYLYIANATDTVWRWTGAAFSQPAGMPTAAWLALMPTSNRLVAGYGSTVEFSVAGNAESWTGNDTVALTPGDDSVLAGLANWQNLVFAFKRNRFFVFTGESIDNDGGAIFNYRTVDGYGAITRPVAGDEGVYFFDGARVWLTTGDVPRRISRNIEPFLAGELGVEITYIGAIADQAALHGAQLSYANGRLYMSVFANGGGTVTLVYDPKIDAWTAYSTRMRAAKGLAAASTDQVSVFWLDYGGAINRFDRSFTQDAGVNMSWVYASGAYDMGYPSQTKVLLESRAWGAGSAAKLRMASDSLTLDTGSVLGLPGPGVTDPPGDAWQSIDREGTWFVHHFSGSGSSDIASISRLVHYVSFLKPSGVQ